MTWSIKNDKRNVNAVEYTSLLPPTWARGGQLQTILGHLLPSPKFKIKGEQIQILLGDGDQLVDHCHAGRSDWVVSIFHGLGSDTSADYMQRTGEVCRKLGHSFFLINHRGQGEGEGLATKPYHSGSASDMILPPCYSLRKMILLCPIKTT